MELNKKTLRKIFLGIAGCIVLFFVLSAPGRIMSIIGKCVSVMMPFFIGAAIAFVLNVPMRGVERLLSGVERPGLRRALAITITVVAVILLLVGAVYLLAPQLVETIESLVTKMPGFFARLKNMGVEYLKENPDLMEWLSNNTDFDAINWSDILQNTVSWITGSLNNIVDLTLTTVVNLGTGIFNAIISIIFAIYCLSRKEILARQGRRLLYAFAPERAADETVRIMRMSNRIFSNFISGQCLEALILGSMFAVAMTIFSMPYVPLISVIIAITALIPIVGAFIGCGIGAFFILVDNPATAIWFIILFLIIQQFEGNVIYPRVVGSSVGLPGMWVLVAVAIGGSIAGAGGMLLMIPLMSVFYALMREITDKRLEKRGIPKEKLLDQPPETRAQFKKQREKNKLARLANKRRGKL